MPWHCKESSSTIKIPVTRTLSYPGTIQMSYKNEYVAFSIQNKAQGWSIGGFMKKFIPKGKNEMILPDDNNPSVSKN